MTDIILDEFDIELNLNKKVEGNTEKLLKKLISKIQELIDKTV